MAYFDLGAFSRPITTSSDAAQIWFDRGLNWIYGYNHEEAVVCFQKAVAEDAGCAMALWGIAYGIGPNYNKPWEFFDADERAASLKTANDALSAAQALGAISGVERDLIAALAERYPTDPTIEDYAPWNDAFSDAMRKVYKQHPKDLDVACIFAEAMMNRTPWLLWDLKTGRPAEGASTTEAREVLERAFALDPKAWDHPGLLHMYIHLMEMSPNPELALRHGDRLTDLVPGSGHLIHMGTHIDVLCGDYETVVRRNEAAAVQDRAYEAYAGGENFYTVYRIHNVHFKAYGAMFLGQPEVALEASEELIRMLPEATVRYLPELFESFHGKKIHVMVRFGQWQAILDEPFPDDPELYLYTITAMHQARAIAFANLGQITDAEAEARMADHAIKRLPDDWMVFNNTAADVLSVGAAMMDGEIAFKSGRHDEGYAHLRTAIERDDNLLYDEPWGWMQPPRHALGALLMERHRFDEAEQIYREDLGLVDTLSRACQHPRNVWSLHGLHECLVRRGEAVESKHIKLLLDQAVARASVPVRASCYCRSNAT